MGYRKVEEILQNEFVDYTAIKGIQERVITRDNSGEGFYKRYIDLNLPLEFSIGDNNFKFSDEDKINDFLKENSSKKRYFYFDSHNGFIYGNVKNFEDNLFIIDPVDRVTFDLIKLVHFKRGEDSYIVKEWVDKELKILSEFKEKLPSYRSDFIKDIFSRKNIYRHLSSKEGLFKGDIILSYSDSLI